MCRWPGGNGGPQLKDGGGWKAIRHRIADLVAEDEKLNWCDHRLWFWHVSAVRTCAHTCHILDWCSQSFIVMPASQDLAERHLM